MSERGNTSALPRQRGIPRMLVTAGFVSMLGACASEQPSASASASVSASAPSPDASNPQSTFPGADWTQAALLRSAFWADGHLGQYAVVVPSLDLVVVNRIDSRLTSKRMGQLKMEKLVWLAESAQNASGIGPEPAN